MRSKLLLSLSVLSLSLFVGITNSNAEDDVFVDYSVLNSLQSNGFTASTQPLFPEVKEEIKPSKKINSSSAKKAKKKAEKKKTLVKTSKDKEVKKPIPEQLSEEVKEIKTQEQQKTLNTLKEALKQNSEETTNMVPSQGMAVNVDKKHVNVETLPKEDIEDKKSAQKNNLENNLKEMSDVKVVPSQVIQVHQDSASKTTTTTQGSSIETSQPIENVTNEIVSKTIVFAENSSELTEADKRQLDKIIEGFKDITNNKIAITSYNLDDGKEVFYRKKQSLDRAIAVRSYLLGKGYKNYSIKVINIPTGDEKVNTVEVFELE